MSIFQVENHQLHRMDVSDASQMSAVDTDNITGGGAGETVDAQTLLDGITGELGSLDSGKQPKTLSSPITVDGTSKTTVEGALSGLNDYADDQEDEISAICNVYGSKNLLKNTLASQTKNDVVFTVYDDGSIKANGTNTGSGFGLNINTYMPLKKGRYIISGFPAEYTASSGLFLTAQINAGTKYDCTKASPSQEFSLATDTIISNVNIWVSAGTVCNNLMFYPMIRDARIKDDTYVPYAMTNQQLTELSVVSDETITEVITGTLNTNSSSLRKYGKICSLSIQLNSITASAYNKWVTVATLANGCKPGKTKYGYFYSPAGGGQMQIDTSGNVKIYPHFNLSNSGVWIDTTYVI